MTIERKVDANPLCRRPLGLFSNPYEAWDHLVRHVLEAREAWNWGVLIPALKAALDTGRRADLHGQARNARAEEVPADLAAIWPAFLELVAAAVEQGIKLEWYWEEEKSPEEGPYRAFASNGILAYLDDEVLRTGFLPFKGELPPGGSEQDRRYKLFCRCWERVQFKYQRAVQQRRIVQAPAALKALMCKVPDQAAWQRLR
jgi:hypothetical protein